MIPSAVLKKIAELSGGRVPTLVCWEAPDDSSAWCHRGYLSMWFKERLGLDVPEHGTEGVGRARPKIPEVFRQRRDDQQGGFAF